MKLSSALRVALLTLSLCSLAACAISSTDNDASPLTAGSVRLNVVKGQTTQTQVLEAFGPPDLVTHKDSQDVWTYDKTTYDYHHQYGYLTVLFAGTGGDRVRSSSRSTMLIIYFDNGDTVADYRLSALKY
jgi:outer membrane protein assembly factor BamE (lipoprotein component of BamABCDE complex)